MPENMNIRPNGSKERPMSAGAKILVLGDSGVGKTRLVRRFVEGTFVSRYVATVGVDFRSKSVKVGGNELVLQIWDTAGQERFRSMTTTIFRGAEGAILVYDVSMRSTFDHLQSWMESIRRSADHSIRIVIVGNKTDKDGEIVVDSRTGKRFAENLGLQFIETSAHSGRNVDKAFVKLANEVCESRRIKESQLFEDETKNTNLSEQSGSSGCLC